MPSQALHGCAIAVALSVFPLIFMGGLVTSHNAGMSVPDWPNSYGYNMFLFPPSKWVGGIFFEHTHRLLGTLSGFLSIGLACLAWGPAANATTRRRLGMFTIAMAGLAVAVALVQVTSAGGLSPRVIASLPHVAVGFGSLGLIGLTAYLCQRRRESRRWIRWLTIAQLLAIIVQGGLGGTRVTEVSLTLAMIHGCFAQVFFCLTAFTVLATSCWWARVPLPRRVARFGTPHRGWLDGDETPEGVPRFGVPNRATHAGAMGRTAVFAAIVWLCVFTQLVVGVLMRHNKAGLAIPDLPLAYGKLLPPTDAAGLAAVNAQRSWQYEFEPVSMAQVWLHFAHRVGAIVVTTAIGLLVFQIVRNHRRTRAIAWPAYILLGLVTTQFTLGVLTVYFRKPAEIASSHVAVGALTLMTTALLAAVAARLGEKAQSPVATGVAMASNLELATA